MYFKLEADVIFQANGIVDAFKQLAEHFYKLSKIKDSDLFEKDSKIKIYPKKDK